MLAIGSVYRKIGRKKYYLAVASTKLLSCCKGKWMETRLSEKQTEALAEVRKLSCEELWDSWGVSEEEFDRKLWEYLKPPPPVRDRPRRKSSEIQDPYEQYRKLRVHRFKGFPSGS